MSEFEKLRARMRSRATPRNGARWYAISNADGSDGDTAVLRIYDEIHWLFGVTPEDFAAELQSITAPNLRVEINSPGGDVFDGIAIFNTLRSHPARVTTRVDGLAASIASVIAQAGDHRVMLTGSQMMIHEAWGLSVGPAQDHRDMADLLDRQSDVIAGIYAERSGRDADEFRDLMSAETWMTAEEAAAAGLADEVVVPDRAQDSAGGPLLRDEISEAVDAVTGAMESAERVAALRTSNGKQLSATNRESLGELRARLDELLASHSDAEPREPREPTEPSPAGAGDVRDVVAREFARFVATTNGVKP